MASGPNESYPAALHPSESVDATTDAPTMSSSASGEHGTFFHLSSLLRTARLSPYEDGSVMSLQAQVRHPYRLIFIPSFIAHAPAPAPISALAVPSPGLSSAPYKTVRPLPQGLGDSQSQSPSTR